MASPVISVAIPLVQELGHAAAAVMFPLFLLFIVGGIVGFLLGMRKRRILFMVSVAALFAALGYCLVGGWGLLTGSLLPLMYVWGRS